MSTGRNILKMLIGIVILAIGVIWYTGPGIPIGGFEIFGWYGDLLVLLKGSIGLVLLFIGLIVAWMGYDDYKMDKEIAKKEGTEEEKPSD